LPTEDAGDVVLVGQIAKAHGLKGEVVVDVWSDAPDRFVAGSTLTARAVTGGARRLVVAESRPFNRRLIVRFAGVEDRAGADALRGLELTIHRSQAAPLAEGRHYRFELLGLRVRTIAGRALGSVADVFATGSNDVIVVRGEAGEMLLPALPGVILEIAVDRGELVVEVPPGLPE
jgi:16S rRNA processing protein RimM